jgi:hypothetical protein
MNSVPLRLRIVSAEGPLGSQRHRVADAEPFPPRLYRSGHAATTSGLFCFELYRRFLVRLLRVGRAEHFFAKAAQPALLRDVPVRFAPPTTPRIALSSLPVFIARIGARRCSSIGVVRSSDSKTPTVGG